MDTPSSVPTDVLDPKGWLNMIPLLHRFTADPRVREAIELGDGKKLHAALKGAKKNPSFMNDVAVIDELLSMRRLFIYGSGAPSLFTINGVGTKIYGKSDEGSDGSYITTLFFTILFIPVIPIKQYLVRHEGDNRYAFFGSVPSSTAIRVWQWLWLGGLAAFCFLPMLGGMIAGVTGGGKGKGSGGGSSFGSSYDTRSVWLVNGLDVPLKVAVKGKDGKDESWKVESQKQTLASLPVGNIELSIQSEDGVEISRDTLSLKDGYKFAAYNIFASAPIYAQGAVYTSKTYVGGKDEKEEYNYFSGQKFIEHDQVTYAFQDPPKTMTFSKYEHKRTIWYTGVEKNGWITTMFLLEKDGKKKEAEELAEAVLLAEPEDETAQKLARYYVRKYKGVEGAAQLGEKMIDMWPNSLEAHRFYQDYAELAGKDQELTEQYKKLYSEDKSAWMGYLYARVAAADTAMPLLEELVQKHPKDAYVHRGYAWLLLNSGKYEEAVEHFEKVQQLDAARHEEVVGEHAKALVAVGRTEDAAKLIEGAEDAKKLPSLHNALLYGQLAKLAPGKTAHEGDFFVNKRGEDDKYGDNLADQVIYDLLVDGAAPTKEDLDDINSPDKRDAIEIAALALKNPKAALNLCKEVPSSALERIEPTVLTMLALESVRVGDKETADTLFKSVPELARHKTPMAAFIKSGKFTPDLNDVDLEWQAAMKLVRARGLPKSDKKRALLVKEAKSQDVLQGYVTHAAMAWAN